MPVWATIPRFLCLDIGIYLTCLYSLKDTDFSNIGLKAATLNRDVTGLPVQTHGSPHLLKLHKALRYTEIHLGTLKPTALRQIRRLFSSRCMFGCRLPLKKPSTSICPPRYPPSSNFLLEPCALNPRLFGPSCELREEALGARLVIHERQYSMQEPTYSDACDPHSVNSSRFYSFGGRIPRKQMALRPNCHVDGRARPQYVSKALTENSTLLYVRTRNVGLPRSGHVEEPPSCARWHRSVQVKVQHSIRRCNRFQSAL